jgi:HK97 family phage portal protein
MIEGWRSQHAGVGNAHKTGLLWSGATYAPVAVSMSDAQYVESQKFSIHQVANILRVPAKRIGAEGDEKEGEFDPAIDAQELLTYSLLSWITRVEQGFGLDDDLFPDKSVAPSTIVNGLLRADYKTRMEGHLKGRQAGWITANEIRHEEGYPSHPDGDELQATPVGGAPNPTDSTQA